MQQQPVITPGKYFAMKSTLDSLTLYTPYMSCCN